MASIKLRIVILIISIATLNACKGHRLSQLEKHIELEILNPKVLNNSEFRNEVDDQGFFVNVYQLSSSEASKVMRNNAFRKLENINGFENNGFSQFLNSDANYIFKEIREEQKITDIVLDIDTNRIMFGEVDVK